MLTIDQIAAHARQACLKSRRVFSFARSRYAIEIVWKASGLAYTSIQHDRIRFRLFPWELDIEQVPGLVLKSFDMRVKEFQVLIPLARGQS